MTPERGKPDLLNHRLCGLRIFTFLGAAKKLSFSADELASPLDSVGPIRQEEIGAKKWADVQPRDK